MKNLTFVMLIAWTSCIGQDTSTIIYDLPTPVKMKALDHIEYRTQKDSSIKFAGLFTKSDQNRYNLALIEYNEENRDKVLGLLSEIIVKTNRFVKVNSFMVPIMTYEDITWANIGTETMADGRTARKRVVFNFDGYSITFDRSGKIYNDQN